MDMTKKKSKKAIRTICISLLSVFVIYFGFAGLVLGLETLSSFVGFEEAQAIPYGQERLEEVASTGIDYLHQPYFSLEISEEPSREEVDLYYFPSKQATEGSPYFLILPGGGYQSCEVKTEGFPFARKANELGYPAFVLDYRVGGVGEKYAALNDVGASLRYIRENASSFGVDAAHYGLIGCSAGGNLSGLFASEEIGYAHYEGIAKPSALILGYPWCRQTVFDPNLCKSFAYAYGNARGYQGLLGSSYTQDEASSMDIVQYVDASYPKVYMMHGNSDWLVPHYSQTDILDSTLSAYGVSHVYELARGVHHGVGLGMGTAAEGWLERGISFAF